MENLKSLRVPALALALVIVAFRALSTIVSTSVLAAPSVYGTFREAAGVTSIRAVDPALDIVVVLLVASCVLVDPPARARTLALLSVVAIGLSVLVGLFLALFGLFNDSVVIVDALHAILTLVVPILSLAVLLRLLDLAPAARSVVGSSTPIEGPSTEPVLEAEQPDPALQPGWSADQAAGASWTSAGEAAAGAPASGWGTPGETGGWGDQQSGEASAESGSTRPESAAPNRAAPVQAGDWAPVEDESRPARAAYEDSTGVPPSDADDETSVRPPLPPRESSGPDFRAHEEDPGRPRW